MSREPQSSDVVVVGAGPAGCAAAYDLVGAGLTVRLLDKHAFPRRKPCAGGLTMRALRSLRYDVTPVVQRVVDSWVLGYGLTREVQFPRFGPIVAMTERAELDAFCLARTREAGAAFSCVGRISAIERDEAGWRVEAADASYRGRWLIGADGVNGVVRGLVASARSRPMTPLDQAVAAEANVPVGDASRYGMEVRLGWVERGYAWVFPKRDHINVGVYARVPTPGLKHSVIEFCRRRVGVELAPRDVFGYRVPLSGDRREHEAGSVLLVGDAAGLAEPLFGEGIFHAIVSGQAAARAIIEQHGGRPDRYATMRRAIERDLRGWRRIADFVDRDPERAHRLFCTRPARYAIMKSTALGLTLGETLWRLPLLPFARVPGRPSVVAGRQRPEHGPSHTRVDPR